MESNLPNKINKNKLRFYDETKSNDSLTKILKNFLNSYKSIWKKQNMEK